MRKRSNGGVSESHEEAQKAPSTVGRGWGSYNKTKEAVSKTFGDDVKFPEGEEVLLKFLEEAPFASYQEHWLKEIKEGRKSFVCIGEECPLCEYGDVPNRFQALFNVVVLDEAGKGTVKIWKASAGPAAEIEKRALAKSTHPLDKPDQYFIVSKVKEKTGFFKYTVDPKKARDLVDDFGVEPLSDDEVDELAKELYDEDVVKLDSVKDLRVIAREHLTDS